jgi:ABC-2 type transport system permease protein
MSADPKSRPSFSPASRWRIGLDLVLRTALVLAVVVMANYLGAKFFHRFYLSSQTRVALSSRTLAVLHSLTNRVDVTLYYDRKADFYPTVAALLDEYRAANKNITVRTVDYLRDAGAAEMVKEKYRQYFNSQSDKDLVIFDCVAPVNDRVKVFPGAALTQYKTVQVPATDPHQKELEFERHPVAFNGEQAFTSILLSLANPQPLKAYFLQFDPNKSPLTDSGNTGFEKFASVLQQNYISVTNLAWIGNAGVPMDCNLLIIAAPDQALLEPELQQIDQYLREGGRLLILFNYLSQAHPTGLEPILQTWGVTVLDDIAQDADHTISTRDIVVDQFGKHTVVNSLSAQLQLYLPRPILKNPGLPANAPDVDVLFGTSAGATLLGNRAEPPHSYPLACAIEQKPVAGVANPRGNTRIIVVGDSVFLGNYYIDSGGNRDFLNACVNWLCDRSALLDGIGPRPVTDYRLQITRHQRRQLRWLLLAALPGGVLFFGWLVWLVRRK